MNTILAEASNDALSQVSTKRGSSKAVGRGFESRRGR